MEQKHVLLSALSVGLGVGVGLGLASGQKWSSGGIRGGDMADEITPELIVQELTRQVVDGKADKVTFDEFPYYLSEKTRALLASAAYVHLKHSELFKHTRNLSVASRAILLSGAAELYHQTLARALANHFDSKLLLIDISEFSMKMQSKYGCSKRETSFKRSVSEATLAHVSNLLGSWSKLQSTEETFGKFKRHGSYADFESRDSEGSSQPPKHRRASSTASETSKSSVNSGVPAPRKPASSWCFDEKTFLQSLYKVVVSVSEKGPIILYFRDVEKFLFRSPRMYNLFSKFLKRLSGSVLVLSSCKPCHEGSSMELKEKLGELFPFNIEIKPPEDETHLANWKAQLDDEMKILRYNDNRNHIAQVLAANDIDCDDLSSICQADNMVLGQCIEEIVVSAISYHLMHKEPEYRNGKLLISAKSLSHGLSLFEEGKLEGNDMLKLETNADSGKETGEEEGAATKADSKGKGEVDKSLPASKKDGENQPPAKAVEPDNEFEKRIRQEVIPANEIGVTFGDIGSMEEIKESLQELVMLPLRRPDLFTGGLLKPCRGILLFGPPGTGKTMLGKAIANEAGASFINVSMSTITSKWFGEDEKNVRALFTLAAKVSPTIIFVDEVDSMLGQRTRVGEHEAMRKIKNEFMTHWDGLMSKPGERILVLAATNRPFDLDEAIIRRFERRIMVGLPSADSREKILKTLLAKEKTQDLDFKELATMTEGYSGSDLKNLCVTAAYRPLRELIQKERTATKDKKKQTEEETNSAQPSDVKEESKEDQVVALRPLNMDDMRQAKNQVAASFASEGSIMHELKSWNDLYGEGGSRKKQQLTYFL